MTSNNRLIPLGTISARNKTNLCLTYIHMTLTYFVMTSNTLPVDHFFGKNKTYHWLAYVCLGLTYSLLTSELFLFKIIHIYSWSRPIIFRMTSDTLLFDFDQLPININPTSG